jgi:hypothetical protein
MKFCLIQFVYFSFWTTFSQIKDEKIPPNTKEIHFVYQMKSNYVINDEGIFADTIAFKIDFPNLKYTLRNNPLDSTLVCGFSTLKNFGNKNKVKLKALLYHANETINGIHFIASKKTVYNVVRGDDETRMIFKKYLKEKFPNFEYRVEIDFVKKTEKINYPRVNYEHTFAEIAKTIEFNNEENIGFYFQTNKGVLYKNIVILNNKLSNFVSPLLFNNNKFGIDKIETIDRTITLKSVFYK